MSSHSGRRPPGWQQPDEGLWEPPPPPPPPPTAGPQHQPPNQWLKPYTPTAKRQIGATNFAVAQDSRPNVGASYTPNTNTITFNPGREGDRSLFRHEAGHMFDWQNGVTGYQEYYQDLPNTDPAYNRGQYGRPVQWQFAAQYPNVNPGALRENPFLAYSLGEENPQRAAESFPGDSATDFSYMRSRGEAYARMNQDPASIPARMRLFFPQFQQSAFTEWTVDRALRNYHGDGRDDQQADIHDQPRRPPRQAPPGWEWHVIKDGDQLDWQLRKPSKSNR